ncbi:MAG: hypothetical protein ABW185_27235 [Sedimenticola sp.]
MNHIIIASDSRGSGLTHFLHQNHHVCTSSNFVHTVVRPHQKLITYASDVASNGPPRNALLSENHTNYVHTIVAPGAKVMTLASEVQNKIRNISLLSDTQPNFYVVIASGICNLTSKINHKRGYEIIYHQTDLKLSNLIRDIDYIYSTLNTANISTKIVHIPPVSLQKAEQYSRQHKTLPNKLTVTPEQQEEQQNKLYNDIDQINQHISAKNVQFDKLSVRWDKDIITCKSKKRGRAGNYKTVLMYNFEHMYDGVHGDVNLKQEWYTQLFRSITKEMAKLHVED